MKKYYIAKSFPEGLKTYGNDFIDDMIKFSGFEVTVETMYNDNLKIRLSNTHHRLNNKHTGYWIHDNVECPVIITTEVDELPEDLFTL